MSFFTERNQIISTMQLAVQNADEARNTAMEDLFTRFKAHYGLDPNSNMTEAKMDNMMDLVVSINNPPVAIAALTDLINAVYAANHP